MRPLPILLSCSLLIAQLPVRAGAAPFDLVGPKLEVTVTHDGVTLPLERVPNLQEGDRVSIRLDAPPGRGERYRMVAAFLPGSIDRPPKSWFHEAESWKPKSATLSLVVPAGARKMALFIAPESGSNAGAVMGTVRKQPGAFVRAVQELNQASLDRARLDTFQREMQEAERKSPASVAAVSPTLTRSLAVKLKTECLQQPAELQAACLTVDRETLLLADTHSSALADTLTGAPTDLAFQLSATPQAGYGAYSSYIGVVRDLFRLFGAFESTQLQFIPALAQRQDERVTVLLNTPLSFAKPTSVMVMALPPIEAPKPPPLRRSIDTAVCAAPGLVLPVEGAPLIYATPYAHDMTVRFDLSDGTTASVPVRADASAGGFVLDGGLPTDRLKPDGEARVQGTWGFVPFDGPSFTLSRPDAGPWKAAERTSLVVGRANDVELVGASAGCVTGVSMRRGDGDARPVEWRQAGPRGIIATLPLDKASPGAVTILIDATGRPAPAAVTLRAYQEAGSLDDLTLHAGDDAATLSGTRLDQVDAVTLGGLTFRPGALTRSGKQDRLTLQANDAAGVAALAEGKAMTAQVTFAGARTRTLSVTVAPPRAPVTLVRVSADAPERSGLLPITLPAGDIFAQDAQLTFAFHMEGTASLSGQEEVEIGTADGRATTTILPGKGYDLQDATTGIVTINPRQALGIAAYGPLRFRVMRDRVGSRWSPLATTVRLPEIGSASCVPNKGCRMVGNRLFLIKSIAATPDAQSVQEVPDGYVSTEITVPAATARRLYLRLRDAPEVVATVPVR